MKTNHFIIPYCGNKRKEVENIYNSIKDNLTGIKTIIEPFCGTSALSYYISTLHPKQFKYILNDNNNYLIELYKIAKNENEFNKFIDEIQTIQENIKTKEEYMAYIKPNNFKTWFLSNTWYCIRPGLYPINGRKRDYKKSKTCPILEFLRTENIEFLNIDALEIIEEHKNKKESLIFLDPPYLNATNSYYSNPSCKVYKYLFDNPINKMESLVVLCLAKMWIIELLFSKYKVIEYDKKYSVHNNSKKTTHIIIINKSQI